MTIMMTTMAIMIDCRRRSFWIDGWIDNMSILNLVVRLLYYTEYILLGVYTIKITMHSNCCEIEYFVESHLFKLYMICTCGSGVSQN